MDTTAPITPPIGPSMPPIMPPVPVQMPQNPKSSSTILRNVGIVLGAIVILVGVGSTVYLSQQQQTVEQHAAVNSPVCITYTQKDSCNSVPDGPIKKTGTTFIIDKCVVNGVTSYYCFDPSKGTYYTQASTCNTGPLGPTDNSKNGHTLLVRKENTTFSCMADCTTYPSLPHCPSASPTPSKAPSGSPTPSLSPTPSSTPSGSPTPTLPPGTGDLNKDGVVNVVDYTLFINCYGDKFQTTSCQVGSAADLNGDGVVDGIDYNILLRAMFGQ